MNQIGPTLPPTTAAPTVPGDSESATSHAPEGDGTFDSLLQQRSGEAADAHEPVAVIASEVEPAPPDNTDDAAEALLSAGLFAMFGLPVVVPPPAPAPAQPLEGVDADLCVEIGAKEIPVTSPEASSPKFSPPADISPVTPVAAAPSSSAPILTAPQKTKPAMIREAAAFSDPVAPVLNVATVRSILRPVQSAIPLSAAETTQRMPIPTPTVSMERDDFMDPSIPATTTGNVPVPFPGKAEQPIILENKIPAPEAPVASPPAPTVEISGKVPVATTSEIFGGMVAANPGRAMSAPTLQRSPSPIAAIPAEISANGAASTVAPSGETPSLRNAPVLAAENERERSANEQSGNPENPLVSKPDFFQTTFSSELRPANAITDSAARIQQSDVAQVVNQTLAATERLRTSGQGRVEVALKLEGGQELTIQLRVANGQVTPTIRTESEPLRLALEQNWSQFSQRSGDRELQITKPVFESPQTSSNMTDLNQQRDGRERAFAEANAEFLQHQSQRGSARSRPAAAPTPASASTPGVRFYA